MNEFQPNEKDKEFFILLLSKVDPDFWNRVAILDVFSNHRINIEIDKDNLELYRNEINRYSELNISLPFSRVDEDLKELTISYNAPQFRFQYRILEINNNSLLINPYIFKSILEYNTTFIPNN